MSDSAEYALVDVTRGSNSAGKILVLLDSAQTAAEMAADLQRRGCDVVVRRVMPRPGLVIGPAVDREPPAPLAVPSTLT
jgi:hypothetical protein